MERMEVTMDFEKTSSSQKQGDGISLHNRLALSGAGLKWIAIICMLIDHVGAVLVEPVIMGGVYYPVLTPKQWVLLYYILRGIGRIAFPIFAFLIVEGFMHTSNRLKYLRNLCIFALVSEIPFNLAIARSVFTLDFQNVFCTLALGLIAIWAMEFIEQKAYARNLSKPVEEFCAILIAVLVAVIAEFANTDYGAIGVLAICIFYKYKQKKTAGAVIVWIMLSFYGWIEVFCLPSVLAVHAYNGERGKQNKYLFYVFYPLHLLILVGIQNVLFL